ncbi:MAG TPA: hypothetical protein VF401_03835 [Candidatus Saccharimonadales bacterium]
MSEIPNFFNIEHLAATVSLTEAQQADLLETTTKEIGAVLGALALRKDAQALQKYWPWNSQILTGDFTGELEGIVTHDQKVLDMHGEGSDHSLTVEGAGLSSLNLNLAFFYADAFNLETRHVLLFATIPDLRAAPNDDLGSVALVLDPEISNQKVTIFKAADGDSHKLATFAKDVLAQGATAA